MPDYYGMVHYVKKNNNNQDSKIFISKTKYKEQIYLNYTLVSVINLCKNILLENQNSVHVTSFSFLTVTFRHFRLGTGSTSFSKFIHKMKGLTLSSLKAHPSVS